MSTEKTNIIYRTKYNIIHSKTGMHFQTYEPSDQGRKSVDVNTFSYNHKTRYIDLKQKQNICDLDLLKKHLRIKNVNGIDYAEIYIRSSHHMSTCIELVKQYNITESRKWHLIPLEDFEIKYEMYNEKMLVNDLLYCLAK